MWERGPVYHSDRPLILKWIIGRDAVDMSVPSQEILEEDKATGTEEITEEDMIGKTRGVVPIIPRACPLEEEHP